MKASAAILLGGQNSRMSGRNKAFVKFGSCSVIEHMMLVLSPLFDDILFISNTDHEQYSSFENVRIISDIIPVKGALAGIHTSVASSVHEHCLVLACDLPLIDGAYIKNLFQKVSESHYAVVPLHSEGIEPLHAFYSKKLLPALEYYLLQEQSLKITSFLNKIPVRYFYTENTPIFANINSPEDLHFYSAYTK